MTDCIFCKIVAGEVPANKLSEDEDFLAFLDNNPITDGHTLIIPKRHYPDFTRLPDDLGEQWLKFSKQVVDALKKGLNISNFNVGMNNGTFAGQAVFHQHTHLIPRREGDGLKHWQSMEEPQNLEEIQQQILSYL